MKLRFLKNLFKKLNVIKTSKFTLIDFLILFIIIGIILFSIYTIVNDEEYNENESNQFIFDSNTINTLPTKYAELYQKGNIITATIDGFNFEGKDMVVQGTVEWVDTYKGGNIKILLNQNNTNKSILATYDSDKADIYIKTVTLRVNGEKYKNVRDIEINPFKVRTLKDLVNKIPDNTNYTISTRVSCDRMANNIFQELSNVLFHDLRKESVRPTFKNAYLQLAIIMANEEDINIASNILGIVDGITDTVVIRTYDASQEQINEIKKNYDVVSITNVT
ncbi:MAG: hypothetical protein LBM96_11445 [Methanobrevibacter sp.]|jgi:hypothetical protein|nr:hypothetical protein [Candidatus Methanoflexus mossambicus]